MDDRIKRLEQEAEASFSRAVSARMEDFSGNQDTQRYKLWETRLRAWEDNKAALDAMAAIDPGYRTAEVAGTRARAENEINEIRDRLPRLKDKFFNNPS